MAFLYSQRGVFYEHVPVVVGEYLPVQRQHFFVLEVAVGVGGVRPQQVVAEEESRPVQEPGGGRGAAAVKARDY